MLQTLSAALGFFFKAFFPCMIVGLNMVIREKLVSGKGVQR